MKVLRLVLLVTAAPLISHAQRAMECDLLIAGGNEAGVAAAVQAARLGVRRIVLVKDIQWLGGQFSAEAVGAIDEWTIYRRRRVNFPRSGLFLEVIRRIREYNGRTYGVTAPGNAFTATDTIEPAAAARIFAELLDPYTEKGSGQVRVVWPYQPVRVKLQGKRVAGVIFEKTTSASDRLDVSARLTIDATDWGDVIRLSGARHGAGPDLKSRFGEENAPEALTGIERNEMNPITYCLVVRETGRDATIPRPPGYDERNYVGSIPQTREAFLQLGWPRGVWRGSMPIFVNTNYPEGMYSGFASIYTHRRLVDRHHNNLPAGTEKVLLNYPTQDYPLYDFPTTVVDALEATEKDASRKNIVDMSPQQRRIVFEDAKQFSLGFLYFLQTTTRQPFAYMELTDEFGTPDRLPWKPYIREGLRLEALYMLREQDIKARENVQGGNEEKYGDLRWARAMVPDNVFGFQFNIDFHPTRRVFLRDDPSGPWMCAQTENRNWGTHTDRAGFPYRSLVPIEIDGLLGASKNLGVSSIASSAIRLHGQMMMTGQAAAAAAHLCLQKGIQPRELARAGLLLRSLQKRLAAGAVGGAGVLLWPYHDLSPDDRYFVAANLLAVRQILPGDPDSLDFQPWRPVLRRELARALARAARSLASAKPYSRGPRTRFADVSDQDPDRVYVESLLDWGVLEARLERFRPDDHADWRTLSQWLRALGWKGSEGLEQHDRRLGKDSPTLVRSELALHLWNAIENLPEYFPDTSRYLASGHDSDGDTIADLDDSLPFDRDNDSLPDRIDPLREDQRPVSPPTR
jgi:hypothetical protein